MAEIQYMKSEIFQKLYFSETVYALYLVTFFEFFRVVEAATVAANNVGMCF